MTPAEIKQLMQQSVALREALTTKRETVWLFLREKVQARYGYAPIDAHTCEKCGKTVYPTLKSIYNAWHPGWCIECVLQAFFDDAELYDPYCDPNAPEYDERHAKEQEFWKNFYTVPEDYDGPPIEWA